MQNTINFNLQKPDYNNVADIGVLNGNFDKIDKGLSPFYVATQSGANVYKVTTGLNKTTLANGYGIRVAILTPSNGAVSITVDGCSAVPVKKANGNPVTNFKPSGVYSLTYYNSVFILASGSDESDSTSVGTDGSKVLEGETFIGSDGEIHTGTIAKRGDSTINLGINQTVELPAGYYTKVKATQNVNYHEGGWTPTEYGIANDYFWQHLDWAYYKSAETRLPISTVARTLGFNEDNVVGNIGGINGNAKRKKSGEVTLSRDEVRTIDLGFVPSIVVLETYEVYTASRIPKRPDSYTFSCNSDSVGSEKAGKVLKYNAGSTSFTIDLSGSLWDGTAKWFAYE